MFKGTTEGYDLDKKFTRAQGAVMILCLAGLESAAVQAKLNSPFTDVKNEHWASPYIAFAYEKKIVRGSSLTTYSTEREMSGNEFLTLALRTLGYTEAEPNSAENMAVKTQLLQQSVAREVLAKPTFLRDDMVLIAHRTLQNI